MHTKERGHACTKGRDFDEYSDTGQDNSKCKKIKGWKGVGQYE